MNHPFYKLKELICYRLKTRHYNGHGIHSPYLYRFVTSILQEKYPYYCFEQIEVQRKTSSDGHPNLRNSKKAHCGQIIFRIIQDAPFRTLLELGTSNGMETQYMAMAKPKARCLCVTKSDELAALAQKRFQKQGLDKIEVHVPQSEETPAKFLKNIDCLDFVLFNQIPNPQDMLDLFNLCLHKKKNGSIFVFMGIHENPEMKNVWQNILTNVYVQVSMDIYDLGIVLFNPELGKKNYVLYSK